MSWIHEYPACIHCRDIAAIRDFYVSHFSAAIVLDLGWYLSLDLPGCRQPLRFLSLRDDWVSLNRPGQTYNIEVADVDHELRRLRAADLRAVTGVQSFGWGDRAFYVADPAGVLLYIYSAGQPSPEILECIRKYG
jgi:catechol 2,3-dioxygenase-like lactoylglutathione lyase family enzyme